MKRITSILIVLFAVVMLTACAKQRDQAPTISGAQLNPVVQKGGTYNPLNGVTADDREDGNLTSSIVVTGFDQDDLNYAGTYAITLSVKDSAGNETRVIINLKVEGTTAAQPPVLNGIKPTQTYYIGSGEFDPIAGVTAIDPEDGNITDDIEVIGTVLYDTPGQYTLTVRVTNAAGIRASASITLTVAVSDIPFQLTTDEISITFWHAMGQENTAIVQKIADDFKLLYPNITVVIPAGVSGYDTLRGNMINAITSNAMPNMVQGYPDHVAEYLNSNRVVNLNPYINSEKWGLSGADALDDIVLEYRRENSQYDEAGTFYSLPFNKSTEVMIYNKTAFTALNLEVPSTWQELVSIAPQLKAYGDAKAEAAVRAANSGLTEQQLEPLITAAKKLVVPASYDSTGNGFITFTRQWGGEYTGYNFTTKLGEFLWVNNANTTAAMQFFKNNNNVITLPEYWQQEFASVPFKAQQTFVTIGSSAGIRYNLPAVDPTTSTSAFELGVAPVPYNGDQPESRAVIQQGTNISIMKTGTSQEQLATWLFLKYLINTKNTMNFAMKTGYLPVRTSARESEVYQTFLVTPGNNDVYYSMASNAAYLQKDFMYYDPAFVGSSRARNQVGLALERIMLGDGNIAEALQEAYVEANLKGDS